MNRSSRAAFHRTTRGAELDISLVGVPRGQRGRALADQLRGAVINGSLEPGTSLPSTRRLAEDLGVSRGVVVEVYDQLVAEGHLIADHGSGTRVAPRVAAAAARTAPLLVPRLAGHNPGQPDPALFPRRDWLRAVAAALHDLPDTAFVYGDARGALELRSVLVPYLGRVRSIVTDPDHVLIVNGIAQAQTCLVQLLRRRGHGATIAVEDPGSAGLVEQLRWWGMELEHVPVDERGIDVAALEGTRAGAVIVTPAHQYPTGVTLGAERRHALVDWARRRGALIVEDDYDAEYRYDREPLTSLHALAPQSVIAAGSVSKCLSPALRLAWLVVPSDCVLELADIKANIDLGTATVPQAALAHFIASGAMDRHLRRSRSKYRRRRDALVETLRAELPDIHIDGIAAGLHVLIRLPQGHDEIEVAEAARALGFAAQPLGRYRHRPGGPGLVLGYASHSTDALRAMARTLAPHLGHPETKPAI